MMKMQTDKTARFTWLPSCWKSAPAPEEYHPRAAGRGKESAGIRQDRLEWLRAYGRR
jgi:hypothetical protein